MNYIFEYYDRIQSGEIVVGAWIRLLYGLIVERINNGTYLYDQQKCDDCIEWIESHCFHTEGILAPGYLILELWQKALLSCIFGLLDPKTGYRQFREIVLIIARKNGKSLLASAIIKYTFYLDGGYGARIFCVAPKLEQAGIVYENTWQMIQLDPEWQALKEAIQSSKDEHNKRTMDDSDLAKRRMSDLYLPSKNSTIKKIAFNAKKSDGFNPSLTICDEIASWEGDKGLKQYDVMKSGMGARPEGLIFSCSTSGYINDSIYDELVKRATRFLLGESKENRLLPFLYMIDDVDRWNDIEELKKSNPNMNVSVTEDYFKEEIAIAEGSLPKKAEFMTKYCNIKQNSSQAWLDTETIDKATGEPISLEDFRGCYCVGGIDLSRTTDLTACNVVIEKDGELYVYSRFFMPSEKIDEATAIDGLPYRIYEKRGFLIPSGDNFVDYRDCMKFFTDLVEKYQIYPIKIGYDRYSSQYLVKDMASYGFHMDDVFQGENLTPVINEFEGLIKDGNIHIGDNDLLKVHLLDSAIKLNAETSRKKLVKLSTNEHIDGMAALLDSFCVRQKYYAEIGAQLTNGG